MAGTKRLVQFPGLLRGQGKEVACTIEALEITSASVPPAYSRYHVIDVSKPLPNGLYELTARGQTKHLRYEGGFWMAAP